ncbi:membrane protein [Clostridia bacterium]|nr:membrane protein [Clostridia bacterium]
MTSRTNSDRTRTIAVTGMLLAVMLMITFMPFLNFQIGPFRVTLLHIPVLIGVVVEGLPVGMGLGLAFGLISMIRAYITPTVTSFVFQNPLISVLPRMLFPLAAWLILRALRGMKRGVGGNEFASYSITALCGTLIHGVMVLGLIYFVYGKAYGEALKLENGLAAVRGTLALTTLTNGVPESIVAAILIPAVANALKRAGLTPKAGL